MSFEESNAKKIDSYIEKNPLAAIRKTHSVIIGGNNVELQVYNLPLDHLIYNIKNGRFASEYEELKNFIESF